MRTKEVHVMKIFFFFENLLSSYLCILIRKITAKTFEVFPWVVLINQTHSQETPTKGSTPGKRN